MSKERKQFSREFKIKVVLAYESGVSAVELSRQFEVHPNVIYNWAREYRKDPDKAFTSGIHPVDPSDAAERRIAELERMLGRLTLENDFLKKALAIAKTISSKDDPRNMKP
jgi:transposase